MSIKAIKWEGKKIKLLRKALIGVYESVPELRRFVDEELNENLATIVAVTNLEQSAYELIVWARKEERIQELYGAFYEEHKNKSKVIELDRKLKSDFLSLEASGSQTQMESQIWNQLEQLFIEQNTLDVCQAFLESYQRCYPHSILREPPSTDIPTTFALLAHIDEPKLAVAFTERAITRIDFSQTGTPDQFATLTAWKQQLASQYPDLAPPPETKVEDSPKGYLQVTLENSGKKTNADGHFVNVYAHLFVTGEAAPIKFNGNQKNCPLSQVDVYLSEVIKQADKAVAAYGCEKVTLEIFLPRRHLEEPVADWEISLDGGSSRPLDKYRPFVIRSYERAKNQTSRNCIQGKWKQLKLTQAHELCQQFHSPTTCPKIGDLEVLLARALGLKLSHDLPTSPNERSELLRDIIDAAVPIAFWATGASGYSPAQREIEFDKLLTAEALVDFAALASAWRSLRTQAGNDEWKHLKLLCDCPDRWPKLPDKSKEADALVSN